MSDLADKLAKVSLGGTSLVPSSAKGTTQTTAPTATTLVDITDEFFATAAQIPYSTIVKCNNFSLLHGTHALEALNPKLDTFTIPKVQFSIEQELDLHSATGVFLGLLKSLNGWLTENISISNSILSCEYISRILAAYTKTGSLDEISEQINESGSQFNLLVYKFCILTISTVKFILELALKSQVYEDEDLNIDEMNLNWLFLLSKNEIFKITTVPLATWKQLELDAQSDDERIHLEFMKNSFQLLYTITSLDSILQWKIPVFNVDGTPQFAKTVQNKLKQLSNIPLLVMTDLNSKDFDMTESPKGCFNSNAQRIFDNQAPPKELRVFEISWKDCAQRFTGLFSDMENIIGIVQMKTAIELTHYIQMLSERGGSDSGMHVLARILFFLFVNNNTVQDANTNAMSNNVLGVEGFTFKRLFYLYMRELAIMNSKIDTEISSASSSRNVEALQQVDYFLDNLSLLWKETMLLPSLNPARQRQLKCKEMKYWNMRQTELGNLEDYFKEIQFYRSNEKYYPLTSTVILLKLQSSADVIIRSIYVNIFKDVREYVSVYYQLTMITYHLDHHIGNVEQMVKKQGVSDYSKQYLQFLRHRNRLVQSVAKVMAKYYELLACLGFDSLPRSLFKHSSLNEEMLYKLQWKQFGVLHDPPMLSFTEYKEQLGEVKKLFAEKKAYVRDLNQELTDAETVIAASFAECEKLMMKMKWGDMLRNPVLEQISNLTEQFHQGKSETEKLLIRINDTETTITPKTYYVCVEESRASFPVARLIKKSK